MSLVSVIIPNYNHAPYLDLRIKSVINQTYRNFELIILDDCSTDESRQVITKYAAHEKVAHIIFNETNSGSTFKQWEKGIELAKGEFIWIAESDDWCEPTMLETLMNGFSGNKDCVLGYVQSYYIINDVVIDKSSNHGLLHEYVNGLPYVQQYLLAANSIFNASMAVFKKDSYFKVAKTFTTFKFCGDWLFWIEIARQGDVFISGKLLNYFRKHKNDVTGRTLQSGYNFIEENRLLEILNTGGIIDTDQLKANLLVRYNSYLFNKKRFTGDVKKAIEESFFMSGDKFKSFLKQNANWLTVFTSKVRRRLDNFLTEL